MMERVTADDGTTLAYRTLGSGSKDTIFVHGWMVSSEVWEDLLEVLDLEDHRLIVPDLRGAGESEAGGDYTIEQYAEDVVAVADAAGADRFDLVGHSMGGQIAQLIAATHPDRVRKLALLLTVPASGMDLPDEVHELFYNAGGDRETLSTILDQVCLNLAADRQQELVDAAADIPADCVRESYTSWTETDFADQLGAITAETMVIASDDPSMPADFLEQAVVEPIADAHLVHIPDAGHYVQVEQTSATKKRLENFLNN
jgi:pimeloyl-ACP methyl ester carboxylesterase